MWKLVSSWFIIQDVTLLGCEYCECSCGGVFVCVFDHCLMCMCAGFVVIHCSYDANRAFLQ